MLILWDEGSGVHPDVHGDTISRREGQLETTCTVHNWRAPL